MLKFCSCLGDSEIEVEVSHLQCSIASGVDDKKLIRAFGVLLTTLGDQAPSPCNRKSACEFVMCCKGESVAMPEISKFKFKLKALSCAGI